MRGDPRAGDSGPEAALDRLAGLAFVEPCLAGCSQEGASRRVLAQLSAAHDAAYEERRPVQPVVSDAYSSRPESRKLVAQHGLSVTGPVSHERRRRRDWASDRDPPRLP